MTWHEKVSEMVSRWLTGMSPPAWFGVEVGLVVVVLTLLLVLARIMPSLWKAAAVVVASVAAGGSMHLALKQAWIADDAFISFRYARNFAEGNGLVFNVGERVEGYTNFLWTLLLALGHWLGVNPALTATALTLGSVGALAIVGAWKLSRPGWLPIAPLLLVLSPAFLEFGTSGLEAGPTAMCIGFCALWLADPKRRHRAAWWVLAAALLRPDHALFFAPLGLLQLFAGRPAVRHTLGAGLAFALYWLGRWAYFGELFPNTFYAKSGGGAYWEQGIPYLVEFSLATGLWLAVPVVLVMALVLAVTPREPGRLPRASLLFSLFGAALYATYVARVGGDFMEFRFGLTSFVLLAFAADRLLSTLSTGRVAATVLAGLALLPFGLAPRLIKDAEKKWYVARESSFYPVKSWRPLEIDSGNWAVGRSLATLPDEGAHAPPLAAGCIGIVGYLSRVPIIDRYGLTNAGIARKPLKDRGRPGHEKWGTTEELMAEGAQWSVDPTWGPPLENVTRFRLGTVDFWMLTHSPALKATVTLPEPTRVLAAIRTPEDAFEQRDTITRLYTPLPEVLAAWRASWGLVDARDLGADGPALTVTSSQITAKDELKVSLHRTCPTPQRLSWTPVKGECSAQELRCTERIEDEPLHCKGAEIQLQDFHLEPLELDARIREASSRGAAALSKVVREADESSLTGLVARFRFDESSDLTRPGVEQSGKVFEITGKPAAGQGLITGMHGPGLLNGFASGDAPMGRLKLSVPVEPGVPVLFSFLFAGGSGCERVYAVVRDGDKQLEKVCARQDEVLRSSAFIITPKTNHVVLEVVDDEAAAWGHGLVDDLLVWKLPPAEANTVAR